MYYTKVSRYDRYDHVNGQEYNACHGLESLAEGFELEAILEEDHAAELDRKVVLKYCNDPVVKEHPLFKLFLHLSKAFCRAKPLDELGHEYE